MNSHFLQDGNKKSDDAREGDTPISEPALQASHKFVSSCSYHHLFDVHSGSSVSADRFSWASDLTDHLCMLNRQQVNNEHAKLSTLVDVLSRHSLIVCIHALGTG